MKFCAFLIYFQCFGLGAIEGTDESLTKEVPLNVAPSISPEQAYNVKLPKMNQSEKFLINDVNSTEYIPSNLSVVDSLHGHYNFLARALNVNLLMGIVTSLSVASSICIQLTPLPTIRYIFRHRNNVCNGCSIPISDTSRVTNTVRHVRYHAHHDIDSLPFVMLFCSSLLWFIYAVLVSNTTLMIPNITGILFGLAYVIVYFRFSHNNEARMKALVNYMKLFSLVLVIQLLIFGAFNLTTSTWILGITAAVSNALTYAAPLSSLRKVIQDKSTASMPCEISLGNLICSFLWTIYGILSYECFILIPSLLGVALGFMQMVLFVIYPPPSRTGFRPLDGCNDTNCIGKDMDHAVAEVARIGSFRECQEPSPRNSEKEHAFEKDQVGMFSPCGISDTLKSRKCEKNGAFSEILGKPKIGN